MATRRTLIAILAVAILAVTAGAGARYWIRHQSSRATEELYSLTLSDPAGKPQPFSQWRGRVLVVNFWATWCEPCREEVPALVQTQSKWVGKGVQIVGIGVDSADKIR